MRSVVLVVGLAAVASSGCLDTGPFKPGANAVFASVQNIASTCRPPTTKADNGDYWGRTCADSDGFREFRETAADSPRFAPGDLYVAQPTGRRSSYSTVHWLGGYWSRGDKARLPC